MNTSNNRIVHILVLFCVIFLSLILYLTYFQLFMSEDIKNNPANPRKRKEESQILRGSIFDSKGTVLAESKFIDKGNSQDELKEQKRTYHKKNLYCHIIGYDSIMYGKTQLEDARNNELLNLSKSSTINDIKKAISNNHSGNNLHLTIDNNVQAKASALLGNTKGSVVAINPKTGAVLALVSKPDFDPNEAALTANWKTLQSSQDFPFLSRATNSTYAPGSTFKTLISTLAFENNEDDFTMYDKGSLLVDGRTISNASRVAHGNVDIGSALAVSSNVYFASLGLKLGDNKILDIASRVYFNQKIPCDIPIKQSSLKYSQMSKNDIAATSIGQGKTLVSPFHLTLIASAIANDGVMMKPYLVSKITNSKDETNSTTKPSELTKVMDKNTSDKVTNIMKGVVQNQNGTATNAQIPGITVAGKTGTAENEKKGKEHSWFMCFAPADDPKIAVVVMAEYTGLHGGDICCPIARNLISFYLNQNHN